MPHLFGLLNFMLPKDFGPQSPLYQQFLPLHILLHIRTHPLLHPIHLRFTLILLLQLISRQDPYFVPNLKSRSAVIVKVRPIQDPWLVERSLLV